MTGICEAVSDHGTQCVKSATHSGAPATHHKDAFGRYWPSDAEAIDPDCRDGKHRACPGYTFDDRPRQHVPCECVCHDPNGPTP